MFGIQQGSDGTGIRKEDAGRDPERKGKKKEKVGAGQMENGKEKKLSTRSPPILNRKVL
jgi:hypothetical protein